jgi:hypothetical protein
MKNQNSNEDASVPLKTARRSAAVSGSGVRTMRILLCCLLSVLFLATSPAFAQERFGNMRGVVKDATGAVLPDASVVLTNKETGRAFTTRTSADGTYYAPELAPGTYSLRIEKAGFARYEVPEATVQLSRTTVVDAQMQVGDVQQTIQVTESAPVIDTTNNLVATNISDEEFMRMPKARTFESLVVTAPSVNTGQVEGGYQVNGASAAENNYYIDGVSVTSVLDGRIRQTAVFEYLQEVQVKTSGIDAEYGGALGGVVAAVTKSGGNEFHGEAHYYLTNDIFNASPAKRLELNPLTELDPSYFYDSKGDFASHEPGFSFGGPFVKNRLWFFTSASPRFQDSKRGYLFGNGESLDYLERDRTYWSWFNKVSFDAHQKLRMNFSWLWTPTTSDGTLLANTGYGPNYSTTTLDAAQGYKSRGYFQPENSLSGDINWTVTPTSLLSVKGGRYYLNYKETGVPTDTFIIYRAPAPTDVGLPADLQRGTGNLTSDAAKVASDLTTRTYIQADFSKFLNLGGTHNLKVGAGTSKMVNRVYDDWYGPNGRVEVYWNSSVVRPGFQPVTGKYGYYLVQEGGTIGSTGGTITHLYAQDSWRIGRLTLNLGLRTERETIPSFQRDVQDYAFRFGFGDKISPRLGATLDVFGDGRIKVFGGWGRYYDWTKYELARGTFGGEVWRTHYRTLDTLDIRSLNINNMPGTNAWAPFRNRRVPGFEYLDPDVKPMSADNSNLGVEWAVEPRTVLSARWVRNHLIRTIEDFGALDETGSEVYRYGNPGEGLYTVGPVSGATCSVQTATGGCGFPMPKAVRNYDALELQLSRRFTAGWFGQLSYVYSRLYGNYAGLQSTDEIRPFGAEGGFGASQQSAADRFRGGGNANRYWDLDEAVYDAYGNAGLLGRLPTDRPHSFKIFGGKTFAFGTEIGAFFRAMSGTPVTTQVNSVNHIPLYVEGRGDMGRTPFFTQTDLQVAHEFRFGEVKRLRLEFNMENLFNQKTSMFIADRLNRELHAESAGVDLSGTDLSQGFDYMSMLQQTPDASEPRGWRDPRYGMDTLFNAGFSGRFGVKFIF